jgi:DNA-binding HxlR family transcriptional regulator
MGDNWTLLIVFELAPGKMRLSELRERLGVGSSVLDRYVQQMRAVGLIERNRFREMPPRVEVELTDAGRELLPVAKALARWGRRHAWSVPQPEEHVDLPALLRMLPALAVQSALEDGVVELVVEDASEPLTERVRIESGRVSTEATSVRGDGRSARVTGSRGDWIAALTTGSTRGCHLTITGDSNIATALLAAVVGLE